jgi:hypothetical protein
MELANTLANVTFDTSVLSPYPDQIVICVIFLEMIY